MKKNVALLFLLYTLLINNALLCQSSITPSLASPSLKRYMSMKDALLNPDSVYYLNLFLVTESNADTFNLNINKLRNLKYLALGVCSIRRLPDGISELAYLEQVKLEASFKLDIEDCINVLSKCSNLKEISFANDSLKYLSNNINLLKNVTKLNISGNQIQYLPAEFFELNKLTTLLWNNNDINTISKEFRNLEQLEELSLNYNSNMNLVEVLSVLGTLPKLKYLGLIDNNLQKIPSQIRLCHSLETLNLSMNQLQHLPDEITELNRLTFIILLGNNFSNDEIERIKEKMTNCFVIWGKRND